MSEGAAPLPPVLIFAPAAIGGIAEYVRYQAQELARRGCNVTVLCTPQFAARPGDGFRREPALLSVAGTSPAARALRVLATVANYYKLAIFILRTRARVVLLEANSDYHALFWAWPHVLLARFGVLYLANFHDPVREHRRGPRWLHRLNLRLSLAPLHGGLIHASPPAEAGLPERLVMRVVPHGLYTDYARHERNVDLRARLAIAPDALLVLAFGHIADRKNLDLLVRALAEVPEMVLVVAGAPSSRQDRPGSHYAALAEELDVAARFRLAEGHVPDKDVSAWFASADVVALTYSGQFVSQSGVLQIAANWDRPVLASGGPGPLRDAVQAFGIGEWIEPDSVPAIVAGIARMRKGGASHSEAFKAYREHASWAKNIDGLIAIIS
ncbi:MAG: glycosyltransferase family 4 protein [Novosphingobium sp.]